MNKAELIEWGRRETERFHRELQEQVGAWMKGVSRPDAQTRLAALAKFREFFGTIKVSEPPDSCTPAEWCRWRQRENDRLVRETIARLDAWHALHVLGTTRH